MKLTDNILQPLSLTATIALAGFSLLQSTPAQASTINTNPSWNGSNSIGSFGEGSFNSPSATYGQTFTVESDNVINNFTFQLNDGGLPIHFGAYLMAWDGSKATGSILYQSAPQLTSGIAGMKPVAFNLGAITLTSGQHYVAFLNTSSTFNINSSNGIMGFDNADNYTGGKFVGAFNGSNFGALTTTAWYSVNNADTTFIANFSPAQSVPEPFTIVGTFVGGVAAFRMKKKLNDSK